MTGEQKRNAALALIAECGSHLRTLSDAHAVRDMVTQLTERAWALQGGPKDRPYLTRTMSQLAHVLRSSGWVEIACSTLEWTVEHGAQDGHVLSEIAECHLARGDRDGAERTLDRARAAGLATDAIYTSLVKAYGRAGQPERARQLSLIHI